MELSSLVLVLLPLLASSAIFIVLTRPRTRTRTSTSSPSISPPSYSTIELIKNAHRIVEWTSDLLLASPSSTILTAMGILTADPLIVEHTVKTRFENYVKGDSTTAPLRDLLGGGIFNANGDSWKLQRLTASLEFSTKNIRTFVMSNVHLEVVNRLLPRLLSAARTGRVFDLQDLLERFGFDNVCKVVFDEDPAQLGIDVDDDESNNLMTDGGQFYIAFEQACSLSMDRFRSVSPLWWKLRRYLSIGGEKSLKEHIAVIDKYAMRVIKSKKSTSTCPSDVDLLSRFIAESGDYSDEFLRDMIVSFVLAGRDTTSSPLTWFFWLISTRPAVQDKIMDEIAQVRARSPPRDDSRFFFNLEQVRDMHYLHAALSETLRLYPPIPLEGRCSTGEDVLPGGLKVAKNQQVTYNSYAMGRSEKLWGKDCGEFRPERWLSEAEGVFVPVNPYHYPVFHAGPRMCLGKDMAYTQMKVVAASVMERFEVEVVGPEEERVMELKLIMKMKDGLKVRIRVRERDVI